MRDVVASVNRLRDLLLDKKNHYSMIRVTPYVVENLTESDYTLMLACGVILWRVKE